MTKQTLARRDRAITRSIHRLFWRAHLQRKGYFFATLFLHAPAFLIYTVLIPFQIAFAIQAIILRQFDRVADYVIAILILTIIYNVCMWVGQWMFARQGVSGGEYVQRTIFTNFLNKDYDFFSNSFFGSLGAQAARMRDAYVEYNGLSMFDSLKQVVVITATIAIIATVSVPLAVVTLICMAVVLSWTVLSSAWRLKYRRMVSRASSDVAGAVGDALSHGTTVKSFGNEDYEERRLGDSLGDWVNAQRKSWDLFAPANAGRTILGSLTICIVLVMTANLYKDGAISIAIVALVQLYVIRLIQSTMEISELIKAYEATMGAAYQPMVTMLAEANIKDPVSPQTVAKAAKLDITFSNVGFSYHESAKNILAVNDFSLTVKEGEKVGLVGYSGSGKTTLTKLLLRFMDVSKGDIKLGGLDIRELSQKDLRTKIAYVPQEPLLFHRSIAENIAYAKPGAKKKEIQKVAGLAHVDEFVDEMPDGYETLVGERGVKLSGGQRQRVAIARALLKDAPILVLDEATSALDSQSERLIQKALFQLMKGRTSLVIAHRLSTIQHMDRIVVMDKGKIAQTGTHQELLKQKKGIYARLWAQQSGGYIGGTPVASPWQGDEAPNLLYTEDKETKRG